MRTAGHCVRCIDNILDGLDLRDVHLVGHSYGGWLAFQTAVRAPDRLASVTLVDPANTVARISARFWRTAGVLTHSRSERVQRVTSGMLGNPAPGSRTDTLVQLVRVGAAEFASLGTPYPRYPHNSLFRSVAVPVQVLLAGNTIHDSGKGIERIRAVVPAWRYRLWPAASHALPIEVPDEVNACIRGFAREHR
jgi:pimeloyl-ACP methyl ester carboxylesterase